MGVTTAVKFHSVFHYEDMQMTTTHNTPAGTSSSPRHQTEEMMSSTEKKLDNLEKKLDQVIELLKQLNMQGDQKKRIPWE